MKNAMSETFPYTDCVTKATKYRYPVVMACLNAQRLPTSALVYTLMKTTIKVTNASGTVDGAEAVLFADLVAVCPPNMSITYRIHANLHDKPPQQTMLEGLGFRVKETRLDVDEEASRTLLRDPHNGYVGRYIYMIFKRA